MADALFCVDQRSTEFQHVTPWTTGTVTVTSFGGNTVMRHGDVVTPSGGSGFASAARHGGRIELVSPMAIYLGDSTRVAQVHAGIATFRVVFAPEPQSLVLLGSGVIALALAGRAHR